MSWSYVSDRVNQQTGTAKMPYRAMLDRLQRKLKSTSNVAKREQIESDIVIIAGILENKRMLEKIMKHLGIDVE